MVQQPRSLHVGLVGKGIGGSITPAMHEAEGKAQGLNITYDLIDTNTEPWNGLSLSEIIDIAQRDGYDGLNITHPYKIAILDLLDYISDDARRLGAVNTVVFAEGKRTGYNTDFSGFTTSFSRLLGDAPKERVLLLGAGGAGSAVAFGLADLGVEKLFIFDQDTDQAGALASKMKPCFPRVDIQCLSHIDSTIAGSLNGVVNATPMGMAKYPGTAFPVELLAPQMWVADIVYIPLETELLCHARSIGCRTMPGSGMAVFQAVHAFKLFTNLSGEPDRFMKTFAELVQP
jgi:shikimate dehydrogenase